MRYSFGFFMLMLLIVTAGCNSVDSDNANSDKDESAVEDETSTNDTIIPGGTIEAEPTHSVSDPEPNEEPVQPKTESESVPSGESNYTNSQSSQSNTNTSQTDNPFASGGSNYWDSEASGTGDAGPNTGPGTSDGTGPSRARKRIKDVDSKSIESNENAIITLILTIDAQGNVVKAYCNKAATTTTNQILINRVIYAVKREVKYSKDPGSILVKVSLKVNIKPS
jgi:hypothetical protein